MSWPVTELLVDPAKLVVDAPPRIQPGAASLAHETRVLASSSPEQQLFADVHELPEHSILRILQGGVKDPNVQHPGLHHRNLMHFAAARPQKLGGAWAVARRLAQLCVGRDVPDALGQTPLFFAAREGNDKCIRFLLHSRCEANFHDKYGQTALFYAARDGQLEAVRLLLNSRADSDTTDKSGQTALFYSAREGHAACVQKLVQEGCCINHADAKGQTALIVAVRNGHHKLMRQFHNLGADFQLNDSLGHTVKVYASSAAMKAALAQVLQGSDITKTRGHQAEGEVEEDAAASGLDNHYDKELGLPSLRAAQQKPVVYLPGLLSEDEIAAVLQEARRHATKFGSVTRDRLGEQDQLQGCWTTHYLHTDHWFQSKFSSLYARLTDTAIAMDHEHWGLLAKAPCAQKHGRPVARCVELHTVQAGGSLADKKHFDSGSLWTLDIMLVSPGKSFTGAEFRALDADGIFRSHSFSRGDAVMFVSHKQHCVNPVLEGLRQVLIIEFWHGEQRQCAHRCTTRWGACDYTAEKSFRERLANASVPLHTWDKPEHGFEIPKASEDGVDPWAVPKSSDNDIFQLCA